MRERFFSMCMAVVFAFCGFKIAETERTLTRLEDGVLRLHILADSDETDDQIRKLLVRDTLIEHAGQWLENAADRSQAEHSISTHLCDIERIAEETLLANGCKDSVQAVLCETDFPSRTYGDVTLPAGRYQTLRVEIGAAKGQNWWCVMYPSLCLPAASRIVASDESEYQQMRENFDASVCDMTLSPEKYEVRLKCVELWRGIKRYVTKKLADAKDIAVIPEGNDTEAEHPAAMHPECRTFPCEAVPDK